MPRRHDIDARTHQVRALRSFLGIDPGSTGAVAMICGDQLQVFDTPVLDQEGRKVIDYRACAQIILAQPSDCLVTIERQWARPAARNGNSHAHGSIGSFGIGYSLGVWLGILGALDCKVFAVTPQAWKKAMIPAHLKDEGKDASRTVCDELFSPSWARYWTRKMDHNRSDAILIAEYGRRTYGGR